jgi:hypothetical protein
MPPKSPITSSVHETKPRLSNAERRAVEVAGAAGRQADLKREAADRRAAREQRDLGKARANKV